MNQVIYNIIDRQKKKDKSSEEKADFDEDDVLQHNSDDEKDNAIDDINSPNSPLAHAELLVEVIIDKVGDIEEVLRADHKMEAIGTSLSSTAIAPLGTQRLHMVELVYKLVCMKHETIYKVLGDSKVFARIIDLVKAFPWNNFLQLKVMGLFEEVLVNSENSDFKANVLKSSGIGPAILEMSEQAEMKLESDRSIRNGFMAVVIDVANKLVKRTEQVGQVAEGST